MDAILVIGIMAGYLAVLIMVGRLSSKGANTHTFFTANKQSPWYLVAFGMIGASLSGVTFISVPGEVGNSFFTYFQVVLGYLLGYFVIATVLMPLYYRLNLVSIYGYLGQRFGFWSYKTGSAFFLLSRTTQAAFRLFLVAIVLQTILFDSLNVPFSISVAVTILLIWTYTFKGGIKTIVWTDTLQTACMLFAIIATLLILTRQLDWSISQAIVHIKESGLSRAFCFEWSNTRFFPKQLGSGALIAIVMTGLDQDMMQKNLTCKTLKEAQKNVCGFSIILVITNILILGLGALLYLYAEKNGITPPERTDRLYPLIALNHLGTFAGMIFLLGIIAAAYSSADSALTALTTTFCVDFLNFSRKEETERKKLRLKVHIGFSLLLFVGILVFSAINHESVINAIFRAAGYTYGPILGLFTFGIVNTRKIRDKYVPFVCISAPILSYFIDQSTGGWFGFFVLALNGLLTFLGLLLISKRKEHL